MAKTQDNSTGIILLLAALLLWFFLGRKKTVAPGQTQGVGGGASDPAPLDPGGFTGMGGTFGGAGASGSFFF